MKALQKKLGKTGGFTLIEMLIVVAIIAILIAVSIPMVNSSLEASRDAADQANERSAKAAAIMVYMGVAELEETSTDGEDGSETDPDVGTDNVPYGLTNDKGNGKLSSGFKINRRDITNPGSAIYYDAARGILTMDSNNIAGYGKCTCTDSDKFSGTTADGESHEGKILKVYVSDGKRDEEHPAGEVVLEWVQVTKNPQSGTSMLK